MNYVTLFRTYTKASVNSVGKIALLTIALTFAVAGRLHAQTPCSSEFEQFTIVATPQAATCMSNGKVTVTLIGSTTNLVEIQYGLTDAFNTSGFTIQPQPNNVISNIPPGTYKVTVRAVCAYDDQYSVVKEVGNVVVGGTYRETEVGLSAQVSRKPYTGCNTGIIALDVQYGSGAFTFTIAEAPAGVTKGQVTPIKNGNVYKFPLETYPAGDYVVEVYDGCYTATFQFTLQPVVGFPTPHTKYQTYYDIEPFASVLSNPNCDSLEWRLRDVDNANADYYRYYNDGMYEVGLGPATSTAPIEDVWVTWITSSVKYRLKGYNIKDFYTPNKLKAFIRIKGCNNSIHATEPFDLRVPQIPSSDIVNYYCDNYDVLLRIWGAACYPLTYNITIMEYDYNNNQYIYHPFSTVTSNEITKNSPALSYGVMYYVTGTDNNGTQFLSGQQYIKNRAPFAEKIGCKEGRYRVESATETCPVEITIRDVSTDAPIGSPVIITSPIVYIAPHNDGFYHVNFPSATSEYKLTAHYLNSTLPDMTINFNPISYPTSYTVSIEENPCSTEGRLVIRSNNYNIPLGTVYTITDPFGATQQIPSNRYNYINYLDWQTLKLGQYTVSIDHGCGTTPITVSVNNNGVYDVSAFTYESYIDCGGMILKPKGKLKLHGSDITTYYRLISGPAGYYTNVISEGESFMLSLPGAYKLGIMPVNNARACAVDTIDVEYTPQIFALDKNKTAAYICSGDYIAHITVTAEGGALPYTFTLLNADFTPTGASADITNGGKTVHFYYGEKDKDYIVRVTDKCGASFDQTVTPVDLTTASIAYSPTARQGNVCIGEDINLMCITLGDTHYNWTGPNGWKADDTQNPTIPNAQLSHSGKYYVSVLPEFCGSIKQDSFLITVNPPPPDPIVPNANIKYCRNASSGSLPVASGATALNGDTLKWYDASHNPYTPPSSINTSTVGTTTYFVKQMDKTTLCESAFVQVTVEITNTGLLTGGKIAPNQTVLPGVQPDSIKTVVPAAGCGNISYQWMMKEEGGAWITATADGNGGHGQNYLPTPPTVTTQYYRRASESGITANSDTVTIIVLDMPDNISDEDCYIERQATTWGIRKSWESTETDLNSLQIPYVGDLDGDGIPEIVAQTTSGAAPVPAIPGVSSPGAKTFAIYKYDQVNRVHKRHKVFSLDAGYILSYDCGAWGMIKTSIGGLIIVLSTDNHLRAYDINGIKKWDTSAGSAYGHWAAVISFADFNNDGNPEIIVRNQLFDAATGAHIATATGGTNTGSSYSDWTHYMTNPYKLSVAIAADMNDDGKPELILGNEIYDVDFGRTQIIQLMDRISPPTNVPADGHAAVVDFNNDGHPDVLISNRNTYTSSGNVYIYVWDVFNHTVSTPVTIPTTQSGKSIPLVSDFNNNGKMDVLIQCGVLTASYRAYEYDTISRTFSNLWNYLPSEDSYSNTATLFDFNQDGNNEILIEDQQQMRILNASTGLQIPGTTFSAAKTTAMQVPIVADIDNDGSAEIIGINASKLNIFKSSGTPWAPARPVWNQYVYSPLNVNKDMSVPRLSPSPTVTFAGKDGVLGTTDDVRPFNNSLQQQTMLDTNGIPLLLTPNAVIDPATTQLTAIDSTLHIRIGVVNQGAVVLGPPVYVTLYMDAVAPANNIGTIIKNVYIPNDGVPVVIDTIISNIKNTQPNPYRPFARLIARINDKGDGTYPVYEECDYSDSVINVPNPAMSLLMEKSAQIVGSSQPDNGVYANPVSVLFNEKIKYTISAVNASLDGNVVTLVDTLPAYMKYDLTPPSSDSHSRVSPFATTDGSLPSRDIVNMTASGVASLGTVVFTFHATPQEGIVASQPMFANRAWVSVKDTTVETWNGTYHQGAGVSVVTFSAGLGGSIFNISQQALDYKTSPRGDALIVPDSGYVFAGWSHDAYTSLRGATVAAQSGVMSLDTLIIYGDVELRATFLPDDAIAKYAAPDAEQEEDAKVDRVWSSGETLYVQTANPGSIVRVYTASGVLLRQRTLLSAGTTTFKLLSGIYIVTLNNGAGQKVRVW